MHRRGEGPYVTIREKSGIIFTFKNKMKVRLCWNAADRDELTARDLDLCLFYRGEDGGTGGVFSSDYRERPEDLGRLDAFPYILHRATRRCPKKVEAPPRKSGSARSAASKRPASVWWTTRRRMPESAFVFRRSGRICRFSNEGRRLSPQQPPL